MKGRALEVYGKIRDLPEYKSKKMHVLYIKKLIKFLAAPRPLVAAPQTETAPEPGAGGGGGGMLAPRISWPV